MGQVLMKNRKKNELKFDIKEEYFIRNGGILLEKQIALCQSQVIEPLQLKVFSAQDTEKATNCFDPDLIVGRVLTTVYKGTVDGQTVAFKVPLHLKTGSVDLELGTEEIDHFLTEASIGMVMNHKNLVKLYGCYLETLLPILVYEFLPYRSLYHCLHGGGTPFRKSITWADRLRVAADVSYALSYMHNALPKPLVHRDVQSLSVHLDQSFHAKVANFGFSVSITPGENPERGPVIGTLGYIETHEVTDKCDVYSFGVLILELLTGRQPSIMATDRLDLVDVFALAVGRNSMMELLDSEVLNSGSVYEIEQFARLALKCVAKKGIERPTMIEIASELWLIGARM